MAVAGERPLTAAAQREVAVSAGDGPGDVRAESGCDHPRRGGERIHWLRSGHVRAGQRDSGRRVLRRGRGRDSGELAGVVGVSCGAVRHHDQDRLDVPSGLAGAFGFRCRMLMPAPPLRER